MSRAFSTSEDVRLSRVVRETKRYSADMKPPQLVSLPTFGEANGLLVVFEASALPLDLVRTFAVVGEDGQLRGQHAHWHCTQLLTAISGRIAVRTEYFGEEAEHVLEDPSIGLLIPPLTWSEQRYLDRPSVLLAICDREFEEADYIRDYKKFKQLSGCST